MLLTLLMTAASGVGCWAQDGAGGAYQASTIVFEKADDGFAMTIKGTMPPTFTTYQLFDPLRVVVDIANASFAESLHLPIEVNQAPINKITGTILAEKQPVIAKLEVLLSVDSKYTVKRNANDISIVFATEVKTPDEKTAKAAEEQAASAPPAASPEAKAEKTEEAAKSLAKGREGLSEIYDLKIRKEANTVNVLLVADGPVQEFTKVALPKGDGHPARMYVDIPGVKAPALIGRCRLMQLVSPGSG